jgi:hypothetical protein
MTPREGLEHQLAALRFDRALALHAHPGQLARAFPGLSETAARQLLDSPRIGPRLSALLGQRLGVADFDTAAFRGDVALAGAMPPAALDRTIRHAGAAALASRLRTIVLGADIRRVTTAIGADAYGFGLAHRGPAPALGIGDNLPVETAIERAGQLCLACWSLDSGPAVAERLRLRLAPERWPETGLPADRTAAAGLFAAALQAVAPHG